jgi:hypothetical protein
MQRRMQCNCDQILQQEEDAARCREVREALWLTGESRYHFQSYRTAALLVLFLSSQQTATNNTKSKLFIDHKTPHSLKYK